VSLELLRLHNATKLVQSSLKLQCNEQMSMDLFPRRVPLVELDILISISTSALSTTLRAKPSGSSLLGNTSRSLSKKCTFPVHCSVSALARCRGQTGIYTCVRQPVPGSVAAVCGCRSAIHDVHQQFGDLYYPSLYIARTLHLCAHDHPCRLRRRQEGHGANRSTVRDYRPVYLQHAAPYIPH
jgi:hypothetical protein